MRATVGTEHTWVGFVHEESPRQRASAGELCFPRWIPPVCPCGACVPVREKRLSGVPLALNTARRARPCHPGGGGDPPSCFAQDSRGRDWRSVLREPLGRGQRGAVVTLPASWASCWVSWTVEKAGGGGPASHPTPSCRGLLSAQPPWMVEGCDPGLRTPGTPCLGRTCLPPAGSGSRWVGKAPGRGKAPERILELL